VGECFGIAVLVLQGRHHRIAEQIVGQFRMPGGAGITEPGHLHRGTAKRQRLEASLGSPAIEINQYIDFICTDALCSLGHAAIP